MMATPLKSPEVHPEDQEIITQLAALQDMHNQILDLRTLLPQRLWDPILTTIRTSAGRKPGSQEALFAHLRKTADDGYREMETFRTAWHSDQMQELRQKTKVESFPQGTDTWKVNYRVQAAQIVKPEKGILDAMDHNDAIEEDVRDVVQKFKTQNTNIRVDVSDDVVVFPLTLRVAGMMFQTEKQANKDGLQYQLTAKLGVNTSSISELQQEIVKAVQNRGKKDNLEYLLNMLASYSDVKTRPCDKCTKLLNEELQFPVVRRRNIKKEDSEADTLWSAYHRTCA